MTSSDAFDISAFAARLDYALEQLERAAPFAKVSYRSRVLDQARRLLMRPGGVAALYERAGRLDDAGIFGGTDWDKPAGLLPRLVGNTLRYGERATIILECLSLLRFLAVAKGAHSVSGLPGDQAQHFLTQVLALNLERIFGSTSEASRVQAGKQEIGETVDAVFAFLLDKIGTDDILGILIDEIWRILEQRPLQVGHVKGMIVQIAVVLEGDAVHGGEMRLGADRLISALFGPTRLSADDVGVERYRSRLDHSDSLAHLKEATGFARAMHDTGLVSDYHAAFVQWLIETDKTNLIPHALGLSSTGLDGYRCYEPLIIAIIREAIHPATGQTLLGLALMLERGILYSPPIAPSLWRMLSINVSEHTAATMTAAFGSACTPRAFLLAGLIDLLGQPLGIGQGNNPTCQSARALSMWALNDPDYLFYLVARVALSDRMVMHFEGQLLDSAELPAGLTSLTPLDTDPVSVLLVPHLDRIYAEMGRRCGDRGEDPHRWINPELHGWWVSRSFHIAVDVATGMMKDHAAFLARFHASYHPLYNGNQPVIHPQPAGIAVTDSRGVFVGWHAISIIRAALDHDGIMRVYFFNPNNDSGQDWGHGVVVSTSGNGERFGEASLPFGQFASRLYIFHDDDLSAQEMGAGVPAEEIGAIMAMARESWAGDRQPLDAAAQAI
ncbi:hypothetical protein [Pararhizobium haloflavum]|uniref:hypothetical protein n=1 Tax=Pararhizobium haloflavum TaxID=2037914 RepID=UPI000C1986B9|nr:hypothetical protein [Pararhizobium haloflavum]